MSSIIFTSGNSSPLHNTQLRYSLILLQRTTRTIVRVNTGVKKIPQHFCWRTCFIYLGIVRLRLSPLGGTQEKRTQIIMLPCLPPILSVITFVITFGVRCDFEWCHICQRNHSSFICSKWIIMWVKGSAIIASADPRS